MKHKFQEMNWTISSGKNKKPSEIWDTTRCFSFFHSWQLNNKKSCTQCLVQGSQSKRNLNIVDQAYCFSWGSLYQRRPTFLAKKSYTKTSTIACTAVLSSIFNLAGKSLVQTQQWIYQRNFRYRFKVSNNKYNITDVVLVSLLTLNRFHTFFWCFRCWIWTSTCRLGSSSIFTVFFKKIPNVNLVFLLLTLIAYFVCYEKYFLEVKKNLSNHSFY